MSILSLVDKDDPLLKEQLPRFEFTEDVDPQQIALDLSETMVHHKGLGIAANQVGLRHRVFAMNGETIFVCFNPRVVAFSDEMVYINEGCLSYPGMVVKIKRPRQVRARFTSPSGETHTMQFDGLTARVFQHELDHLNGIRHIDLADPFHKEKAVKDWKKYNRIMRKTGR
jgi:peptide deformylase